MIESVSMPLQILSLTVDRSDEACAFADNIFDYCKGAKPTHWFRASLHPTELPTLRGLEPGVKGPVGYWIADIGGRVVGTTGLYEMEEDQATTDWLGWFCTDPEFRNQGVAKHLILHTIDVSRQRGKKLLRLYTSRHPRESSAQFFYDKYGFPITEEKDVGQEYPYVYREKSLV